MTAHIDCYLTAISPFAFLGHDALSAVAEKHGKTIEYKPFNMFGVWEVSGAVPPMKRPPVRQRYRLIELQRVAEFRGIDLVLKPTHFPTDPTLADHCAIAISQSGGNPGKFLRAVGEAVWVKNKQIADVDLLAGLLNDNGYSADEIIAQAGSQEVSDERAANTQAAIAADAVGAPAYVYDGEVFWGQDRIDYLDHMLSTGRSAFSAE